LKREFPGDAADAVCPEEYRRLAHPDALNFTKIQTNIAIMSARSLSSQFSFQSCMGWSP
jgi:hypothetical protein